MKQGKNSVCIAVVNYYNNMFCKNCGVKVKIGSKFCQSCGQEIKVGRFTLLRARFFEWLKDHRKAILIISGVILFFVIVSAYDEYSTSPSSPQDFSSSQSNSYNQEEIASSVVNIFCPSTRSEEEASGGSGTIIDEEGLILTNSHIVPQDETNIFVDDTGCLVVLPDPVSGQPDEVFLAHPIVIPGISDNYDLAYMQIYSAFYDEEEAKYAGTYPRVFPAFDDTTRCRNENVQLGEPVRIFGYPAISGGYSLTITDGVVSSFPGEGLIVTSAKISHGNSGGLAVDRHGCMIGVPSMFRADEAESLGIIISTELMNSFSDEVSKYINSLEN